MSSIQKIEARIKEVITNVNANNTDIVFGTYCPVGTSIEKLNEKTYPMLRVAECRKIKPKSGSPEMSDEWNLLLEATKPFVSDETRTAIDLMSDLDDSLDIFFEELENILGAEWIITSEITYEFDTQIHSDGNVAVFARLTIKCFD
jgi:hypothetical protein